MGKRFNLYISIFIAVFIYILFLLSVILYLKKENVEKFSSKFDETIIELDFVVNNDLKDAKINSNVDTSNDVLEVETQQSGSLEIKRDLDPKSLFANFTAKSENIAVKEVIETNTNSVNSRFKSKIEQQNEIKSIELSKLIDVKEVTNSNKIQNNMLDNGKYDEYYSKINKHILTRWYSFPLVTDIKYLVTANITINSKGNFSFVMVKYSGNARIDEAIKEFLQNQALERYPIPPDMLTKTIKINFKPYVD